MEPIEKIFKPKSYNLQGYQGLSEYQLTEHYTLYLGYVNKYNEILTRLKNTDFAAANQTYSDLRALKIGENFALNGIKLHEAYFENLCPQQFVSGKILEMTTNTFGSYENFKYQFSQCGIAARGWTILSYDLEQRKLLINCLDAHDQGYLVNSYPLLVMDVYEHAYLIDYGVKRAIYIEAFFQNIAWNIVNLRLEQALAINK
ncbi:MAG: superoxide dismutase [Syntrophomonadaceae bacterium]|nr:superoxide dismutase [Syntrophomonadaceae bacterium]